MSNLEDELNKYNIYNHIISHCNYFLSFSFSLNNCICFLYNDVSYALHVSCTHWQKFTLKTLDMSKECQTHSRGKEECHVQHDVQDMCPLCSVWAWQCTLKQILLLQSQGWTLKKSAEIYVNWSVSTKIAYF